MGRLAAEILDKPFIDNIELLSSELQQSLFNIAKPARDKKRISSEAMRTIILELCRGQFIAISELAKLVNRTSQNIRQSHLKLLVAENKLRLAFPQAPNTPKQGYTSQDDNT
jgi:ATP-dependent DNA helicase RecG